MYECLDRIKKIATKDRCFIWYVSCTPSFKTSTHIPSSPSLSLLFLPAVSTSTHLYVIGGHDHQLKRRSDVIYVMNEETGEWTESPVRLMSGRSNHSCAYYNNAIWIAGGVLGPSSSVSPMGSSSSSSGSGGSNSGGKSSSSSSGSSSSSSGGSSSQQQHQQQPAASTSPRSVAAAAVEIVDLTTGTVTVGPSMQHERYQLKLVVVNDRLYAVAGTESADILTHIPSLVQIIYLSSLFTLTYPLSPYSYRRYEWR